MKAILALASLAVFGFAAAGCGATKKVGINLGGLGTPAITVTATRTIPNVATGTLVWCEGGPGAKVPPPGQGVTGSAGEGAATRTTTTHALAGEIRLVHLQDGSITVSCTPFH